MGARNRQRKKEKALKQAIEKKQEITTYRDEFKVFCTGKTLRQIIIDYTTAKNVSPNYFFALYTDKELQSVIFI